MRDKNSPGHGLLKCHWHFVFLSVTLPDMTRQGKADPNAGRQAQHGNTFPIFRQLLLHLTKEGYFPSKATLMFYLRQGTYLAWDPAMLRSEGCLALQDPGIMG